MDIYEEISLFAKRQRDEVSKEKKKRRREKKEGEEKA